MKTRIKPRRFTIEELRKIVQLKKEFGTGQAFSIVGSIAHVAEKRLAEREKKEAKKKLLLKRAKEMGLI